MRRRVQRSRSDGPLGVLGLALLLGFALVGGCASIAGLDRDYALGSLAGGGPTGGGAEAGSGGSAAGTTTSTSSAGGAATTTSSSAAGGNGGGGLEPAGGAGGEDTHIGELLASLDGLRIEFPCLDGGTPYCATSGDVEDGRTAVGLADAIYDVEILVRGVLETGGHTGGTAEGQLYVGGQVSDNWNSYGLDVSDPPASYFVNHGVCCEPRCYEINIATTIRVRTGASVRLWGDDRNSLSTRNRDGSGTPIVVDGVLSASEDGQFVQLNAVAASVAPR